MYYTKKENFNLDHLNMLDKVIKETKLNSTFVYECLKNLRILSCTKSGLSGIVRQLRLDFADHLNKRIYLLKHLREIQPGTSVLFKTDEGQNIGSDPWIISSLTQSSNEAQLIAVSLHIRDILFACREIPCIIQGTPEKKQDFLKELEVFNSTYLPDYLALVKNMNSQEKSKITQAFQKLQTLMEENKFEEVPSQLSTIRKLLRHSGIPPSNDASLSTDTNEAS